MKNKVKGKNIRNIVLLTLVIAIAVWASIFFQARPLTEYMTNRDFTVEKLDAASISVHVVDMRFEDITDEDLLNELLAILSDIIVRPQLFVPQYYSPTFADDYLLNLSVSNKAHFNVYIKDKAHVEVLYRVNGKEYTNLRFQNYKIVGGTDVSEIYELLIRYEYLQPYITQ